MSESPAARAAVTAAGGRVLVTATMRTDAGSRPAPRAASATARRTAAMRAAIPSGKETRLRDHPLHLRRLRAREADDQALRRFARARALIDLRGQDVVGNAEPGEQLAAARRCGGEHEHPRMLRGRPEAVKPEAVKEAVKLPGPRT